MTDSTASGSVKDWRRDVLPEITEECLDCIRTVERKKPTHPAKSSSCAIDDDPDSINHQISTCGDYSISRSYYEDCSTKVLKEATAIRWELCAFNATCARNCVSNHVNSARVFGCGRGFSEARLCVDYGIIHVFGANACRLKSDSQQIRQYANWMIEHCGVVDPPALPYSTPVINDDCLDCIRIVERDGYLTPAMRDGCIEQNWPQALLTERVTCGEYSISESYYERCSTRQGSIIKNTTATDWKECAMDPECARNCIQNFVNTARTVDCGRGTIEARHCIDYGIIHAFREDACALIDQNPDVRQYATSMRDRCGIGKLPLLNTTTSTSTSSTMPGPEVLIAFTAGVAIVLIIILSVVIWYKKFRKRRTLENDSIMRERSISGSLSELELSYGVTNSPPAFSTNQLSEEIQNTIKENLIALKDVEVMEEIGRGQFGVIRKAKYFTNAKHTQCKMVAVKILHNRNSDKYEEEMKSLLREAHIMNQLEHVNVISLVGVIWENDEPPVVVCPYMGKGSLLDLIKKAEIKFSEYDLMYFVSQIASGLEYLEVMKLVHRDIALRNCLVSNLYVVKICDFGLSRDIYLTRIYKCADFGEKRLPWKWIAPECMAQGSFTHKSDVWSFGITIWELFSNGCLPYPAIGNIAVLQECLETGYRLSRPDRLSQQLYDLMRLMWSAEPADRPSFKHLHSAIQLMASKQDSHLEYSYTTKPRALNSPASDSRTPATHAYVDSYSLESADHKYVDLPVQYAESPLLYQNSPL